MECLHTIGDIITKISVNYVINLHAALLFTCLFLWVYLLGMCYILWVCVIWLCGCRLGLRSGSYEIYKWVCV
jgi:hypothetical protein